MLRLVTAALVFLVSAGAASAGEVELRYEAVPEGAKGGLTYLEVEAGPVPALEVRGPQGERYQVGMTLHSGADELVTIDVNVQAIKEKRRGERLMPHVQLSTSVSDGETAIVRIPAVGQGAAVELHVTPRLSKVAVRRKADSDLRPLPSEVAGEAKAAEEAEEAEDDDSRDTGTPDDSGDGERDDPDRIQ